MSVSANKIAEVLGGTQILGCHVGRMIELEEVVRAGIPKESLDNIMKLLSVAGFAQNSLSLRSSIVPRATYQRVQKLSLQHSETVERIARLYAILESAFEDNKAAARFLMNAHPELDGRAPIEVALTEIGGRQVEEVIERGLHGLPA